ncbi:hypothetical protein MNBD_GAMMA20-29 [hydrothermal vent metagenome]|uniref:PpiC domain-containing protein n=1 Tax=hydrothermal vent metagenome TaxID=652676 RepID=A0A3B1A0H6_9ZZZZ
MDLKVDKGMSARLLFLLLMWVFSISSVLATETEAPQENDSEEPLSYLAIIDGEEIPIGEYVSALRRGMRDRFYHGTIPEEEQKKFYQEVADELIQRFLLVREARQRNILPDVGAVEAAVEQYDERFQKDPDWAKAREEVLPQVRNKLEADSLALRLEEAVKVIGKPTEKELEEFYESNKALFTTPERVKVSLILLRVDPSSTGEVWQQASEEASAIVARLTKGADFAELARIHSSDESAQNGGDMGYTHSGMLGDAAQKVLDIMEIGDTSAPVMMLEGVAIFRLQDKITSELNPLDAVRERAESLYLREMGEKAWEDLIADLRSKAKIEINDAPWR